MIELPVDNTKKKGKETEADHEPQTPTTPTVEVGIRSQD
ncbi:hypothetical protein PR003_g33218 [Phytophthora rubi]|uniref:Uncharacterized protein n=1 Tax=Phytophthora rubi TaxID=129364 RepID=A0A6A4AYC0_9STRA|nr:hypothetical protein PR003_g33218 [Phytophthora rubi]